MDYSPSTPVTTWYYYDGDRVLAEYDDSDSLKRYFVDGPTYIDEHVLMYVASVNKDYFYLLKELYTTAGMVYPNGNPAELYVYNTYGEVTIDPGLYFDSDGDGDVDLVDFGPFQVCYTGSGGGPVDIDCAMMDNDGDGDVDQADFSAFQTCYASSSSSAMSGGGSTSSLSAGGTSSMLSGSLVLVDIEAFDACYTGPDQGPVDSECTQYDAEADNDVDLWDYCALTGCSGLFSPPGGQSATADQGGTPTTIPPGGASEEETLFGDATPTGTFAGRDTQSLTEGGVACDRPRQPYSTITNPYFFTGRRLDYIESATLPSYHYRARTYTPIHGRFQQHDPMEYVDGMNLFEYVKERPLTLVDPTGRWHANVHEVLTSKWARMEGFSGLSADLIGIENIATDGTYGKPDWYQSFHGEGTGFTHSFFNGDQSRHFDRSDGGGDTRIDWIRHDLKDAKDACKNDKPGTAATHLGRALHSLQDWWAHGDYSSGSGQVVIPHSLPYDTWGLDAAPVSSNNGNGVRVVMPYANGRAPNDFVYSDPYYTMNVRIPTEISWRNWKPGTLRQQGTERDSRRLMRRFVEFAKKNGGCVCRSFFFDK